MLHLRMQTVKQKYEKRLLHFSDHIVDNLSANVYELIYSL